MCLQAILAKLEMNLARVDQLPWILSWLLRMLSAMTTPLHNTTAQLEVPPIADTLWHSSSDTSTRGSSLHSHVDKVGALTWVERSGYLQCKKSSPCPKRTRDPTRLKKTLKRTFNANSTDDFDNYSSPLKYGSHVLIQAKSTQIKPYQK
jgi:hypothetical protein